MDGKEEEFLKKLLSTFRIEAKEHITAITEGLIKLEKAGSQEQMDLIESIFREVHSLKGASRSVNLIEIESICQSIESVFSSLKKKEINISSQLLDELHTAVDFVRETILSEEEIKTPEAERMRDIIKGLENIKSGTGFQSVPEPSPAISVEHGHPEIIPDISAAENIETIRMSSAKMDSLLFQVEEMLSVKLSAAERASELQDICDSLEIWERDWMRTQSGLQMLEKEQQNIYQKEIIRMQFLLKNEHIFIKSIESKLKIIKKKIDEENRQFGMMMDNLLEDMKKALMLPFSSISGIFPKIVRDLSHDQGKTVDITIDGEEIEIDRYILEEMKDSLIHIIRNCIDHGIETPDERKQKNKNPKGNIRMSLTPKDGNRLEIKISDDGRGIDISQLKSSAIRRGIITKEQSEKINDREALNLIFLSGISTSQIITEVSGRGLGLAIVQDKVEKLNGTVTFHTQKEKGTEFFIILPLTLAKFRGLLVDVNDQIFVIPLTNVDRTLRVKKEEIKTVENRETISLEGHIISVISLGDVLEMPHRISTDSDIVQIAILASAQERMAFTMQNILSENEVIIKNMGRQLVRVRNIAGATVLGNGIVVPVLNVHDLIKSAMKVMFSPVKKAEISAASIRKSILVAEDSITARMLLKNILETAGYDVRTAIDGIEALTILKTTFFDAVVSDVDMPGMNGFDLTAKIRSDARLSELPVVLVTALESKEDKERGIDVGANAYIVKSSFDQSNLLEVLRGLI